jgi:hypothetical protein
MTPGQAVVCYDGDVVVCGGTITSTNRTRRSDHAIGAQAAG